MYILVMSEYDFFADKTKSLPARILNQIYLQKLQGIVTTYTKNTNTSICEVGPGDGFLGDRLQEMGYSYSCCERSKTLADSLIKKGLKVYQQSAPPLPHADNSQEMVVLSNVLEHMDGLFQSQQLLRECHRVLRNTGQLLIVCPDIRDWKSTFYEADYTHQFPTSPLAIKQLLQDEQFEIVRFSFIYGSLKWFPGWFLRKLSQFFIFMIGPVSGFSVPLRWKSTRLDTLFARNQVILARKLKQ